MQLSFSIYLELNRAGGRHMFRIILFLLLTNVIYAHAVECPQANDLHRYVRTALREDALNSVAGDIDIYYRLLKPYDVSQPTLLVINGGPGGDSTLIGAFGALSPSFNIVSFDHRGLGCTRIMSPAPPGFQNGLFSMSRAADDIEAIRRDLIGADKQWYVYGVSYGTFLGQEYVSKYPAGVAGAVLDSAMLNSDAIEIARRQYIDLFIRSSSAVSENFDAFVSRYPDFRDAVLRAIRGSTYTYEGRTVEIPMLFSRLLRASGPEQVQAILAESSDWDGPLGGMQRSILCGEIWDFSNDVESNRFYWKALAEDCGTFLPIRRAMDFTERLKTLPVRVFIWGGRFDPVTPIQSMHQMQTLIPDSLLWENPQAGHALYFEMPVCAQVLLSRFIGGASNSDLLSIANGANCQNAPDRAWGFAAFQRYVNPGASLLF